MTLRRRARWGRRASLAPRRHRRQAPGPPLPTTVGSVRLPNAVMTAAGTAGHGAELGAYLDLSALGAVVVKSLAPFPWAGNPPPRVHPAGAGMLNSVGLQGPGVEAWLARDLPALEGAGARVVVSIWGRTVEDYAEAARQLAACRSPALIAVELNVSCPNLEDRNRMFGHSPARTAEVLAATADCRWPRWAKLSPNTDQLVEVAGAAQQAGAAAVTLVNTLVGMAIDPETRRPVLGARKGGLSGPPLHAVAVRAVFDVHEALPTLPIVGVGGVRSGLDAVELVLAGASAVQVGTASFADPRAALTVSAQLGRWAADHGVADLAELVGAAHRPPLDAAPEPAPKRRFPQRASGAVPAANPPSPERHP